MAQLLLPYIKGTRLVAIVVVLAAIIVDSAVSEKRLKELSALNACISVSYAHI